ncbi:DNA-processing protein DprA [Effusibacillus pohliae]|uniref:DNA-processing protein DprA n=1 Tax=Effusibacillus pohliae TaxID=232270 RepID=UPI00036BA97D|nr:DNA-processing protein DprA [Effusibacillus pohliae]
MRTESEYVQWLMSVPGVGYLRCRRLLERFGSAEAVWDAAEPELLQVASITPNIAREICRSKRTYSFREQADFLSRSGIRVIHQTDPEYPPVLLQIPDPPHILFVKGEFSPTDQRSIAVVGARNATNYGLLVTNKLCTELAAGGVTIISGLAIGIDATAHAAALQAGGRTIAVLACGLLRVYPPQNRLLAERISRQGVLLSEFSPFTHAHPGMFPIRNRLIAGLARGVLVVEAARKSGSLITADQALEQGRDVFAVPGPITSPLSQGTNDLIRQGAKMITGVEEIWEEYPDWCANQYPVKSTGSVRMTAEERILLDTIGYGAVHVEHLLRACRLPKGEVHRLLLELELKGLIRQMPGQMYMRCTV